MIYYCKSYVTMEIRDTGLKKFQSYLSERKQYVTYNHTKSSIKSIRCGVPQGSILGPLLFLIYINDLVSVCQHTMAIPFADTTSSFINGDNLLQMVQILNAELDDIWNWPKVNKLSLNKNNSLYDSYIKAHSQPRPCHQEWRSQTWWSAKYRISRSLPR